MISFYFFFILLDNFQFDLYSVGESRFISLHPSSLYVFSTYLKAYFVFLSSFSFFCAKLENCIMRKVFVAKYSRREQKGMAKNIPICTPCAGFEISSRPLSRFANKMFQPATNKVCILLTYILSFLKNN